MRRTRRTSRSVMMIVLALLALGLASSVVAQDEEVFVEIKKGEVMRVIGATLMVNVEGEGIKMVVVPAGFRFDMDGEKVPIEALRPGMILTSVKIATTETVRSIAAEEAEKAAEEEEAKAAAAGSDEPMPVKATPTPAPPPPPAPAPEPEDTTMRTVGIIALILIVIGIVIWFMRKKD